MNGRTDFISSAEAAKITSLHPHTLRKYADNNQIKCYKTQFKWTCREQFCKRILFEDFQDALLT